MFPLLLLACAPKAPALPDGERPLLLWRVERDGKASHLLGTCHIGVPLADALPAPHDAVLDGARVVYTEAALDAAEPAALLRLVWSSGPGLSARLSDEDWRATAVAVRDQLPASVLDHFEPWAAAVLVPLVVGGETFAGGKGQSMDAEVQKRAKARGIPLAYVETVEAQAAMMAGFNDAFLEGLGPRGDDDGAAQQAALDALCLRGDTSGAAVLHDPADPTTDALLVARNRAWVPNLLPALAEGDAFVAVGAGHMLGDAGLLALLAAEGFSVRQLTTDRAPVTQAMPSMTRPIAPAPPPSPAYAAYEAQLVASLPAAICADGQLVRACFEPDRDRCVARMTEDVRVCARQHADLFPAEAGALPASLERQLTGCVPAGIVFDAIANERVGDGPMCAMVRGAMSGALGK
jgi:uncharacterized protein YbaP (TraB family)